MEERKQKVDMIKFHLLKIGELVSELSEKDVILDFEISTNKKTVTFNNTEVFEGKLTASAKTEL